MIKLVIFDLDGTLLDTIGDLAAACDAALSIKGLPRHTPGACRRMVGNGIRNLVVRALPEELRRDEAFVEEVRCAFVDYYIDHIDVHTRPYDGITGLLERLSARGVKMAVVSNKFQSGAAKLVGSFFSDVEFVAVFGQREGVPLKPDPQADREIMQLAGVGSSETLHVGDSAVDIETARAAGIRSVGVTWGFRSREEIVASGADFVVGSIEELESVLTNTLL